MEPHEPIEQLTSWLIKIEARLRLFEWSSRAELSRDFEQVEPTHKPQAFSTSLGERIMDRDRSEKPGKDELKRQKKD